MNPLFTGGEHLFPVLCAAAALIALCAAAVHLRRKRRKKPLTPTQLTDNPYRRIYPERGRRKK